jgi:hypothetical protein
MDKKNFTKTKKNSLSNSVLKNGIGFDMDPRIQHYSTVYLTADLDARSQIDAVRDFDVTLTFTSSM